MPALLALINGKTILFGGTRLKRIPTKLNNPTWTFAANAEIHSPTGTKLNRTIKNTKISTIKIIPGIILFPPCFL